ncbi:sensor histidine kinase [Leifsonia sp. 1010]|uniref:sensor histidine kinase n=1 Tax=Leifsonia sp. 1010 TaxID=2817769 RepID=UPI002856262D|nr:sensor histidine kinase [Leifsonia sp. 1010]MDR6611424.1 signal transduction histidine kinase [Leifsonia sp. 1010]
MAERADDRWFGDWIGYSAAATLASVLLILANPITGWPRTIASAVLVLALFPIYWFLARPSRAGVRSDSWRAWLYVGIATAVYFVAYGFNNWANIALFIVSPQFFLVLSAVPAAVAIVVINLGGVLVRWLVGDLEPGDVAGTLGLTVLVIAVSVYFSNRITAVTKESRERGLLIQRLREQQREIAELSEQQGAAAERERIAREMHDTLAQGFTSIVTLGHAVQGELDSDPATARRHIELMTDTAQENLQESRRIIAALTPGRLAESTLEQALGRVAGRFEEEAGVPVAFGVTGDPRPAPPALEVVALRVFQEALANVRKHAAAGSVDASLAYEPDALVLTVHDDGRGFDASAPRDGYGLDGMQARVREAGGTFALTTAFGEGTLLTVRLPAPIEEVP